METKERLELNDVVGYLPYGLKCVCSKWDSTQVLTGLKDNGMYFFGEIGILDICVDDFKPILRPMTDLYKPMIHEGKEIVPLVELAKISFPDNEWEMINGYLESNIGSWFWFSEGSFCCDGYIHNHVPNQVELFDFLSQLHFDHRNLIGSGLAIDINTVNLTNK